MTEQKAAGVTVSFKGALMSALLIISFFLPRIWANNSIVSSINTLLILVILVLAINVINSTAALFENTKAKIAVFTCLFLLPVFNIAVACVQFIFADAVNPAAEWFTAILVVLSLPVFCCLYFTAVCLFHKNDKRMLIGVAALDITGILYVIIRLADKVIVESASGEVLAQISPWFSFVIYLASLALFIICAHSFICADES